MICPSCRREIAEGSRFCPFCGNTLPDTAVESPPAPPQAPPVPGPVPLPGPPRGPGANAGFQQRAGQAVALGAFGTLLSFGSCLCCVFPLASIGLGWAAFARGRDEMRDIENGYLSSETRGMASAAMILGIVSMGFGALGFAFTLLWVFLTIAGSAPR